MWCNILVDSRLVKLNSKFSLNIARAYVSLRLVEIKQENAQIKVSLARLTLRNLRGNITY